MIHEIASIHINRPAERVYAFLSDPKNRLKYDPELIDVHYSPEGPLRLGSRIVEVRRLMGRKGEMRTEVSALESNRLIAYRTLEVDPTNAYGAYTFEPTAAGSLLKLDFSLDPRGIMKLFVPLMRGRLKRDIRSGLENIKIYLENQPESEV